MLKMLLKKSVFHKMRLQPLWVSALLLAMGLPALAQDPLCGYDPGLSCPGTNYNNAFMKSTTAATLEYDNWVSTYHSTLVRRSDGQFSVWGEGIDNSGTGSFSAATGHVLSPQLLNNVNYPALGTATVLKVAGASSGSRLSTQINFSILSQWIALTDQGLFAWGVQGIVIESSITTSNVFQKISINGQADGLPAGIDPVDVKMITATRNTLAIVTCSGAVYVLSQLADMRGNGATGNSTTWYQVTTTAAGNPALANVVAVRLAEETAFALTSANTLHTWGTSTLVSGSAYAVRNRAAGVSNPNTGKTIKMIGLTATGAITTRRQLGIYYVLMADGFLYAMGENSERAVGDWSTTDRTSWVRPRYNSTAGPTMDNIQWISPRNMTKTVTTVSPFSVAGYTNSGIGVLTTGGILYVWGSDDGGSLAGGNTNANINPQIPAGLTSSTECTAFHLGGHTGMLTICGEPSFGYIGHRINGSMGNGEDLDAFEDDYTFITARVPICGSNLPYFDGYLPENIRARGGELCVGTVYDVVAEPIGGTITVSDPSLVLLGGNAVSGYTIEFTAPGTATITYQGLAQNGCTPGPISEDVTAASCDSLYFNCVADEWIDGNTGLAVDLSADNSTGFETYALIMRCCNEEGLISGQLTVGEIIITCGDIVVEGCLTVVTDGTVTNSAPSTSAIVMRSTTDAEYGQYFGPATQIEFDMIMAEDGWHNLALPVASATAQNLADANNTTANPRLINVSGLSSFVGEANIELYNSAISGGKEMGFVRTDGLYSTHAYGTWSPATSTMQLAKIGFNYYIDPYFTNGMRKLSVSGLSLAENVNITTSDNFGGWNLIPNPYPVTLDVQEMYDMGFFKVNNDPAETDLVFDAAVWIWDGAENFTPGPPFEPETGSYVLQDAITGTQISNGSDLTSSAAYIAPFQSFWVRRTSAYTARRMDADGTDLQAVAVSVAINATTDPAPLHKTTNAPLTGVGGPLVGNRTAIVKPEFRAACNITKHYKSQSNFDLIKFRVSNGLNPSLFDETLLTFGSAFDFDYELGYDIVRNSSRNGAPFIVSDVSGKGLAINRMAFPTATSQVPLFFDADGQNQPFQLEINESTAGYTVFVEDLKNGKWHEVSKSPYVFINDVSFTGKRFILHFKMGPADIAEFQPQVRAWRAKEGLTVQFNNIRHQKARVRITDATGRMLLNEKGVDTNFDFIYPAQNLAAGVYFITITTEKGTWVEKIAI